MKKSWREKLADDKGLPKVGPIAGSKTHRLGTGTMVVPAPREVDQLMQRVPKGKLTTIDDLRKSLALAHRADIACPFATGIFAWIAAYAADEAEQAGAKRVTPYWRTLKAKGELNPKYPGGLANLRKRLAAEGHQIIQKGKRHFVADHDRAAARL